MADIPKFSIDPSVIYQLGESLISDPVQALLELVKNSYDADASYSKVTIDTSENIEVDGLQYSTDSGVIIIEDDGFGMNETDIENGWLRISNRQKMTLKLKKKTTPLGRTPLGDKGLGRLGTQRLGHNLEIFTKKEESDYEYQYSFSWDDFSKVKKIEDVEVYTRKIESEKKKGTKIVISNLKEINVWEENELKSLQKELSVMISPYKEAREFYVMISINGTKLELIDMSKKIRDIAQLHYDIYFDKTTFNVTGKVRLDFFKGKNPEDYLLYAVPDNGETFIKYLMNQQKSKIFNLKKTNGKKWFLEYSMSIKLEDIDGLEVYNENDKVKIYNPGPFKGEVDHFDLSPATYNDQNIFDSIAEFRDKIKFISGIGIYRNGFGIRVDRDWLKLGAQWTSAGSYYGLKPENASGYITITAKDNINLEEMTDREGFKKTPYYNNFFNIIQEFVSFSGNIQEYLRRSWLYFCRKRNEDKININLYKDVKAISDEIKKRIKESKTHQKSLNDIKSRIEKGKIEVQRTHEKLKSSNTISEKFKNEIESTLNLIQPLLQDSTEKIITIREYLAQLEPIENMEQVVSDRIERLKEKLDDFIETVALGLTAEALSHEIFNITDTLSQRADSIKKYLFKQKNYDINISSFIEYIKATTLALRKQISYLSPALKYVRDKKQNINLKDFFLEFEEHYRIRLEKNGISMRIKTEQLDLFEVKINRGKLLQIFDNFILNSEYWLKEDIRMKRLKKGNAEIIIELDNPFVRVSDNGRGIDTLLESIIFEPFISAKGKGKGRGLGLFIIKQFLDSEGCSVDLIPKRNLYKRLYKFQIDFRGTLND